MILGIIQARMGSTRLPGKMIKKINKKPLIWHVVNRTKKAKLIDQIILATTKNKEDKVLLRKAKEYGIKGFAGSEKDVLDRFYQAAKKFKADKIVRITGDCPLLDPAIIDKTIKIFLKNKVDYVSNIVPPTFPDGLDVELFSFRTLEKLWKITKKKHEREHVTAHIRENPERYKILNLYSQRDLSGLRFTVDNEEDLKFVRMVYKRITSRFRLKDILKLIEENPSILKINQKYKRDDGFSGWKKHWQKGEDSKQKFAKSLALLKKAKQIIPTASQTYSKSYKYFCEGAAPVFLEKGKGSHLWDVDGNEYLDFVCALGAVTVGYDDTRINKAIISQLKKGISFTLPHRLEVELAEKLQEIIPCVQMVKFVKNGSDATSAAVRLARAYTKREIVAGCGYHGYQDWYIGSTENDRGVPKSLKKLIKTFKYNDIDSLKKIFNRNKNKVAAVILEPCQDNGPEKGFLKKVKELTRRHGAILIFDEVVSGFRLGLAGAQGYYKITPDLSAFGKGLGNGVSVSAVVGKKKIMKLIDEGVFISTTFGGEAISLAAALATIKILEKPSSFKHIWRLGNKWKRAVQRLIDKKKLRSVVKVSGLAPHCGVIFKGKGKLSNFDLLSVYQQTLIEKGILSIGINNFCLSHTNEEVEQFIKAVDLALDKIKEALEANSLKGILKGKKFRPVFKR